MAQRRIGMLDNFKFGLFVKVLTFYICIFLIPFLIFGTVLSRYVMSCYKNEVLSSNFNAVNYIRRMIDEDMEDISVASLQLSQSEEIMDFVSRTDMTTENKAYYVKQVADEIDNYRLYKSFIGEIHLYAAASDCVVTPNAYLTPEAYYEKYLPNSGISLEQWIKYLTNPRATSEPIVSELSDDGTTATIVKPGIRDSDGNYATLLIVLNKKNIVDTYSELVLGGRETYFAITSGKDILIESDAPPVEYDAEALFHGNGGMQETGDGHVIFSSKSQNRGLNYVCIMSEKQILSGVRKINGYLAIFIVVMTLILLVLSFLFSNKTFKPIKNLAVLGIGENAYNFNNLKELQGFLVNIVNSNNQLNETVLRQKEYISDSFFKAFIWDSMSVDESELATMFANTTISLNEKYFRAAIVELKGKKFDNNDNFNIISGFQNIFNKYKIKYSVVPNGSGEIILVLAYDKGDENVKIAFEKIAEHLENSYHIHSRAGVGREVTSPNKFTRSYEDALFGLEKGTQSVYVADKTPNISYAEYFDFIKKDKLIYDIHNGDAETVKKFFEEITKKVFFENVTTYGIQNYIRYMLDEILREAFGENADTDVHLKKYLSECANALTTQNTKESIERIEKCFIGACGYVVRGKEKKERDLINEIVQYIKKNYSDPFITLKQISEELNISYKYISEEFKKKTGMKFIDYLHDVRNKEAKKLLLTTDLKVLEISEMVGYTGSNAFVKIFKKLNGITPGKFRKSGKL